MMGQETNRYIYFSTVLVKRNKVIFVYRNEFSPLLVDSLVTEIALHDY